MGRSLFAAVMLTGMYLVSLAFGQEEMTRVNSDAFENPSRPEALFVHDAHNEKAGLGECTSCHHIFENGVLQKDDSSVGTPCSECHQPSDRGETPSLMRAFHLRCKSCHQELKSGPLMCGECHKRPN